MSAMTFVCPNCLASHNRGWFNGVDIFRCLACGYTGYGHHHDEHIDAEIEQDIRDASEWNRGMGLPEDL